MFADQADVSNLSTMGLVRQNFADSCVENIEPNFEEVRPDFKVQQGIIVTVTKDSFSKVPTLRVDGAMWKFVLPGSCYFCYAADHLVSKCPARAAHPEQQKHRAEEQNKTRLASLEFMNNKPPQAPNPVETEDKVSTEKSDDDEESSTESENDRMSDDNNYAPKNDEMDTLRGLVGDATVLALGEERAASAASELDDVMLKCLQAEIQLTVLPRVINGDVTLPPTAFSTLESLFWSRTDLLGLEGWETLDYTALLNSSPYILLKIFTPSEIAEHARLTLQPSSHDE